MAQILFNKEYLKKDIPFQRNDIIELILKKSLFPDFFLVVPTARLARTIKREIIDNYYSLYKKPCPHINVVTFAQFVQKIYNKLFINDESLRISEPFSLTLLSQAVQKCDLKFFKQNAKSLSTVVTQKLANIILGLRADGISSKNLKQDIDSADNDESSVTNVSRLADIYELYTEYERLLGNEYVDPPGILLKVLSKLNSLCIGETLFVDNNSNDTEVKIKLNEIFGINGILIFDGFTEFRNPEIELINYLSDVDFAVGLRLDYSHINGPLFSNLKLTVEQLIGAGYNVKDTSEIYFQSADLPNNEYLRRWLFNTELDIKNHSIESMLEIKSFTSKDNEIKFISKFIKSKITEEGYKPKDICIVSRKPQDYSRMFREYFGLNSIPVNISDRFRLDQSPVTIAVFSLLNLITKGFPREDLNSVLRNRYLEFNAEFDVNNLYETALNLRIKGGNEKGGKKLWLTRFESSLRNYESILNIRKNDTTSDETDKWFLDRRLKSIKKARDDFKSITDTIPDFDRYSLPFEISEFIQKEIIEKFGVRKSIEKYYNSLNSSLTELKKVQLKEDFEKDARAFSMFLEILNETVFILEKLTPDKKYSLSAFTDVLKIAVSNSKYQIREKNDYGVTVTSIEQTRGINYKLLILCGTVDKTFPMPYTPERFLGKELPESESRHIASEKMLFYQFLTNNKNSFNKREQRLLITYPLKENNLDLVRSPFIDSVVKIISDEGTLVTHIQDKEIDSIITNNGENIAIGNNIENNVIQIERTLDRAIGKIDDLLLKPEYRDEYGKTTPDSYSVSSLELNAKCPFRYFASKILNLKEISDSEDKLSHMERGNLFHIIAYRFYSELANSSDKEIKRIKAKTDILPDLIAVKLVQSSRQTYLDRILEIAEEEFNTYKFIHHNYDFEKELMVGNDDKKGLLEIWLDDELRRMDNPLWNYYPCLFEFSFGSEKEGVLAPIELSENLKLRGKIDRIDIDPHNDRLLIGDYKKTSSSIPKYKDIEEGQSFQIPLYSIAMNIIFENYYNFDPQFSGGIYYFYTPQSKQTTKILGNISLLIQNEEHIQRKNNPIKNNEDLQRVLESSLEKAEELIQSLESGHIGTTKDLKNCEYCKFGNLCRINGR